MEFIDDSGKSYFKKLLECNTDDDTSSWYTREILKYAERWANIMESRLSDIVTVADIAESTSAEADNGISGYMYNVAVILLVRCWKHGEELRRWHNIHTDPEQGKEANERGSTINSAIFMINKSGDKNGL